MTENAAPDSSALPGQVSNYQPRSFRERGVAVPFTTPVLSGGRVRIGGRQTAELVVCNPSGGRSVYILPLSAITEICAPTLHDRALQAEILRLEVLTPAAMRAAARRIAAGGAGGRGSMRQASHAEPSLQAAQLRAQAVLRAGVLRGNAPMQDFGLLAKLFGCQEIVLEHRLIALANLLAELGIGGTETDAMPTAARRVAQIDTLATSLAENQSSVSGRLGRAVAELVENATLAHATAQAVLDEAMAMTAEPSNLLRRFIHETLGITQLLSRIDWLLDGWDRICLLWQDACEASSRPARATLQEMILHAPRLPAEAHDWIPPAAAANATFHELDTSAVADDEANPPQRPIGPGEIIARNERIAAELAAA